MPGSAFVPHASEGDHHLDRLALVHGPIPVGDFVEADDAVEDAAGLDPAFEDVRSSTGLATRPL